MYNNAHLILYTVTCTCIYIYIERAVYIYIYIYYIHKDRASEIAQHICKHYVLPNMRSITPTYAFGPP